jgi:hypothetical protein
MPLAPKISMIIAAFTYSRSDSSSRSSCDHSVLYPTVAMSMQGRESDRRSFA